MKEKTINREEIYSGKVISVYRDEVQIDEKKRAFREIVEHRGAVCALAVTMDDKIVLVKQFRKAVEQDLIEIPAGKLEIGEEPVEAIGRELKEETGYEIRSLKYVTSFYTSPGFSNEQGHLYFAKLGEQGQPCFDEDEDIEIYHYSLSETMDMIKNGKIRDAKTILAIALYHQECLGAEREI
ncbi:MAG: NUDIX hydrolase [Peptostreptococcaceae bacterium]|nr:NUDIX hydrolase [Peptostreptococcaceae bacterium]